MTREIIIMAKSKKFQNYCIAGFDVRNGQWVRLVSDDTDIARAVPVEDARYADGTPVEVLDVVKVHTIEDGEVVTTASQRENVFYDSNFVWEKAGHKTIDEVVRTYGTDACDCVFGNTAASLTDEEVDGTSLLFLNVDYPIINIYEKKGVLKARLNFRYNGIWYNNIPVTDIEIASEYINLGLGRYRLGRNCKLVLSLGCRYKSKYYKLAAQIFANRPAIQQHTINSPEVCCF